ALIRLVLDDNRIGNEGALHLAKALKNHRTLTSLSLKSNCIGDQGAQYLAHALETNAVLTSFDLQKNQIGNEGVNCFVNALKKNTNLKNLYLDENEMTDGKAVSAILRFRDYTNNCLRLDFYGMGDNLIELLSSVLQRNKTIQHISLITNKIGDRGAQVLASLIKDSKVIMLLA
ncbi:unnamed protein product, partial [Rotaria magnacalcarata]